MKEFDVIIIGGSYAGLSAAMTLGRALRNVLVIDSGNPCNIQTPHSHNFLTRDGETPAVISGIAKEQVLAYPTIEILNDEAVSASREGKEFVVSTLSRNFIAKKLLFATGIKDIMPEFPGFAESWGISVIHCPYCHGYEVRNEPTAVLGNGDAGFEFGRFIHHWTNTVTLLTNGVSELSEERRTMLDSMKIKVVENEIERLNQENGKVSAVLFADGTKLDITAMYARLLFVQKCSIPIQLGCEVNQQQLLKVDNVQKTSVAGVFAAGDCSSQMRSVSSSVATGAMAGAFINHELIQESFLVS